MSYSLADTTEKNFQSLHKAVDVVARELKFLAFTQAPALDQSVAFYRSIIDKDFPHFVVLNNNSVVGWCDVAPVMGESRAHIGTLGIALLPEARHQGWGSKLMEVAIAKSWVKGLSRIELTVRSDNTNARALYERFGFQVEGIRRNGSLVAGKYHDVVSMALLHA